MAAFGVTLAKQLPTKGESFQSDSSQRGNKKELCNELDLKKSIPEPLRNGIKDVPHKNKNGIIIPTTTSEKDGKGRAVSNTDRVVKELFRDITKCYVPESLHEDCLDSSQLLFAHKRCILKTNGTNFCQPATEPEVNTKETQSLIDDVCEINEERDVNEITQNETEAKTFRSVSREDPSCYYEDDGLDESIIEAKYGHLFNETFLDKVTNMDSDYICYYGLSNCILNQFEDNLDVHYKDDNRDENVETFLYNIGLATQAVDIFMSKCLEPGFFEHHTLRNQVLEYVDECLKAAAASKSSNTFPYKSGELDKTLLKDKPGESLWLHPIKIINIRSNGDETKCIADIEARARQLEENNGRMLFHATLANSAKDIIENHINLEKVRPNLDFNDTRRGFYLGTSIVQAREWMDKKLKWNKSNFGSILVFEVENFEEWLQQYKGKFMEDPEDMELWRQVITYYRFHSSGQLFNLKNVHPQLRKEDDIDYLGGPMAINLTESYEWNPNRIGVSQFEQLCIKSKSMKDNFVFLKSAIFIKIEQDEIKRRQQERRNLHDDSRSSENEDGSSGSDREPGKSNDQGQSTSGTFSNNPKDHPTKIDTRHTSTNYSLRSSTNVGKNQLEKKMKSSQVLKRDSRSQSRSDDQLLDVKKNKIASKEIPPINCERRKIGHQMSLH